MEKNNLEKTGEILSLRNTIYIITVQRHHETWTPDICISIKQSTILNHFKLQKNVLTVVMDTTLICGLARVGSYNVTAASRLP